MQTSSRRCDPFPTMSSVACLHLLDKTTLVTPGSAGAATWAAISFNPGTDWCTSEPPDQRRMDEYRQVPSDWRYRNGGRIVAMDPVTNRLVWQKHTDWSLSTNGMLTTAGNVMFIGQPDGYLVGYDINNGRNCGDSRPERVCTPRRSLTASTVSSTSPCLPVATACLMPRRQATISGVQVRWQGAPGRHAHAADYTTADHCGGSERSTVANTVLLDSQPPRVLNRPPARTRCIRRIWWFRSERL